MAETTELKDLFDVKFAKLRDTAVLPTRKHPTDAGIDLYADLQASGRLFYALEPGECLIVSTGVTVELPEYHFGWITNKSRNDFLIGGGIVDQGYQGELLVKVMNVTKDRIYIRHGDAVAQFIILPATYFGLRYEELDNIHTTKTDRGGTGGIVTQVKPGG